jgi:hypothetical protein
MQWIFFLVFSSSLAVWVVFGAMQHRATEELSIILRGASLPCSRGQNGHLLRSQIVGMPSKKSCGQLFAY